ncbi:hypothetical protein J437_LFUL016868 [Ladona fulva]|uniref:Uncharacterized protein n=1 Tax=Ladona fulva TaxID=123851 RepID=A0A8K0KJS2_LADFU|nr:hypothetical protein J437_LFUL016868 [Ladona fulva]
MQTTFALALALAVVAVHSLPQFNAPTKFIPILEHDEVRDDAGQFRLRRRHSPTRFLPRYVSGDGTTLTEVGKLIPNDDGTDQVLVKEGSYTFTAPEGKTYTVNYVADKDGFRASGDHIPRA